MQSITMLISTMHSLQLRSLSNYWQGTMAYITRFPIFSEVLCRAVFQYDVMLKDKLDTRQINTR